MNRNHPSEMIERKSREIRRVDPTAESHARIRAATSALLVNPPERVVFWSGAGISGDAPTQGPLGLVLTNRALDQAFDASSLLTPLREAYRALGLNRDKPRLESVLDIATAEHGVELLSELLSDLATPPSNGDHQFFAAHTRRGGYHVTTNFDGCIEAANGDPTHIVHVHGLLSGPGGPAQLGARISTVERGITGSVMEALDQALTAADLLVVVGYNGLDYFDVDPYWRAASSRGVFRDKTVLWVNHDEIDWALFSGTDCTRKQLRIFEEIGHARVLELAAPTRQVLNLMAGRWGISWIPEPPHTEERTAPRVSLVENQKRRATTRFLAAAGLSAQIRERLSGETLDAQEHLWAADAAWAAGRYGEAQSHWDSAYVGGDPTTIARRLERQGACMWLRGQLLRARRVLSYALEDPRTNGCAPEVRLTTAETLGRVLVHMARLPDTRLLVTRRWKVLALTALDEAESALSAPMGIDQQARVESVRADLTGKSVDIEAESGPRRDFDEAEWLHSMLNYEHAWLRSRAEAAERGEGEPPRPSEFVQHRDRFRALGAEGDAARVPLLPEAMMAFGVWDSIRGLSSCDFTPYHLVRLSVGCVMQRMKRRVISS